MLCVIVIFQLCIHVFCIFPPGGQRNDEASSTLNIRAKILLLSA